jgi:arsenate reductase
MKVLFVCRGNIGRSQMAAAFYNKLSGTNNAESAGTHVWKPGQTLLERKHELKGKSYIVDVMAEEGIDVSNAVQTQLTKDMLKNYDLVVNMAGVKYTPKWLKDSPNYEFWKVRDAMGRNHQVTVRARDAVKQKVTDLLKSKQLTGA